MAERWVINASPIILLAKAEVIHLLPDLCDEIIISAGVAAEVQQGRVADSARRWLSSSGSRFVRPSPKIQPELSDWKGGAGEAEVISWALLDRECKVVLDDARARHLAQRLGLAVLGALGLIVRAKKTGLIAAAKPVLEKLRGAAGYVTDELIDLAIAAAGEDKKRS